MIYSAYNDGWLKASLGFKERNPYDQWIGRTESDYYKSWARGYQDWHKAKALKRMAEANGCV
jgi:hypothetical protein